MGIGINARVEYSLNEKFAIAPNFTYWFSGDILKVWQLNADVHYTFSGDEALSFYGLGGLNITGVSIDSDYGGGSNTEIGLNLGAGAKLNQKFFGEVKFDTEMEQLALTVGILF